MGFLYYQLKKEGIFENKVDDPQRGNRQNLINSL
jgi:hypothetical protein